MKGQISIEFMIFLSILLIIFIVFVSSGTSIRYKLIEIKSNVEAKELSDEIAFEINTAVRIGDGYERGFYVEDSLFWGDFNISVGNYFVFIDWSEKSVGSSIITKDIVGSIVKGWNTINNTNGIIYVN